ncbi:MAG: DUF3341 domain-containing protein [Candidatus Competibacteraceae bacterium]|nr:DUF3341 domain-containing protein [Candidatus Competibacteraceae bacterium]
MGKKTILAVFEDPDETLYGAKHLMSKGVKIREVYSPFPIHGIDKALGVKPTRISTVAFFYGVMGVSLALLMMWYMNVQDWAMNIGGKPSFSLSQNLPAFIPVTFEITVLIAAHLMNFTFLFRSRLFPGFKSMNPDLRATDDKFVMEIVLDDNKVSADELKAMVKETKAIEINDAELKYKD